VALDTGHAPMSAIAHVGPPYRSHRKRIRRDPDLCSTSQKSTCVLFYASLHPFLVLPECWIRPIETTRRRGTFTG
jgi:hypothetical protein